MGPIEVFRRRNGNPRMDPPLLLELELLLDPPPLLPIGGVLPSPPALPPPQAAAARAHTTVSELHTRRTLTPNLRLRMGNVSLARAPRAPAPGLWGCDLPPPAAPAW